MEAETMEDMMSRVLRDCEARNYQSIRKAIKEEINEQLFSNLSEAIDQIEVEVLEVKKSVSRIDVSARINNIVVLGIPGKNDEAPTDRDAAIQELANNPKMTALRQ